MFKLWVNNYDIMYAKRYEIKPLPFAFLKQLLEKSNCFCTYIYMFYIDLEVVTRFGSYCVFLLVTLMSELYKIL